MSKGLRPTVANKHFKNTIKIMENAFLISSRLLFNSETCLKRPPYHLHLAMSQMVMLIKKFKATFSWPTINRFHCMNKYQYIRTFTGLRKPKVH